MIQTNRTSSTDHDVSVRNSVFENFVNSASGGSIYLNGTSLNFELYVCIFKSCSSQGNGGAVHVENSLNSNVFSICGSNCTSASFGQFMRLIVSSAVNNAALVSLTKCGPKSNAGSAESFIVGHGSKFFLHDINASDCHITGNYIIAPDDTSGAGYVRYLTIAKSSARSASRICNGALTIYYFNIVNNELSSSVLMTYGKPRCENSVFKNNLCEKLVDGVATTFYKCYFDKVMTGSFTTDSCDVGVIKYNLMKINNEYMPHCYNKILCTKRQRQMIPGKFVYFVILIIS